MTDLAAMKNLFDRWERVWHQGEFGLVPDCVAPQYVRHDEMGNRTVSQEDYRAELVELRKNRPDVRNIVYDHAFSGDCAWYRFTMKWTDQQCGEVRTRAGMQSYRIEDGKLAETWVLFQPLGSAWADAMAQKSWTNPIRQELPSS